VPKVVDHDTRRRELVEIAWRMIAREGVEGVTLRGLAEAAGYANGALKPYFPTKDELFRATFEYVFERTNERVVARTRGLVGWEAVEAFGLEVLPLTADARDEARVVMAYWAVAAQYPETAALTVGQQALWRRWLTDWVAEAIAAGRVRSGVRLSSAAEALLTFFEGAQVVGVLDPVGGAARSLRAQLGEMISGWSAPGAPGE